MIRLVALRESRIPHFNNKGYSMTGKRRPRRSNSLKDLKRLLGGAEVAHGQSRHDRLLEHAAALADTEAAARENYFKIQILNLFAPDLGFRFVVNDLDALGGAARVFHFLEERPGAVGKALLDDGPVGRALRHLKALSLDEGAPAPLGRQGGTKWKSAHRGGPLPRDKKLATETKAKINETIAALRERDPAFMAKIEAEKKKRRDTADLMARWYDPHHFEHSWQELVTSDEPDKG
jgi:hypothetical protein